MTLNESQPFHHSRTNGLREELSALSKLRESRAAEEEEEELHGRKLQQEEIAKRAREIAELCVAPVPLLPSNYKSPPKDIDHILQGVPKQSYCSSVALKLQVTSQR